MQCIGFTTSYKKESKIAQRIPLKKKESKKTKSTIVRIYRLVGSWRILFGAIFGAIGTIVIFSPNLPLINNWYTESCPYFHSLSQGLNRLSDFQIELSSPDYREEEKSLKKGEEGFDAILTILEGIASQKIKRMTVQEITNRRSNTLREQSGEYLDVLNLVHMHDPNAKPPYVLVTTESDLRLRIDIHRQIWIEGVGTAIVLVGIFWPYFWQLLVFMKDAL